MHAIGSPPLIYIITMIACFSLQYLEAEQLSSFFRLSCWLLACDLFLPDHTLYVRKGYTSEQYGVKATFGEMEALSHKVADPSEKLLAEFLAKLKVWSRGGSICLSTLSILISWVKFDISPCYLIACGYLAAGSWHIQRVHGLLSVF